tara:strand:+ start:42 stop:542 length:501 start_codon:yes stop_codon:yes gene_type:complete
MSGIIDMIELFRGEAPSRSGLNFRENRGRYFTPDKNFARHIAQGGSLSQNKLIKDLGGKVKSLKIPLSKYKELGGNSLEVLLDDATLGKAKTNVIQTMMAKAGSFTPLAMKGLSILSSLPVATATMFLQSTPANADEINMTLEDFAKLNEGSTNVDKALPTKIGDM